MTVQTLWGYVQMFVYDTGRDMMDSGVVPGGEHAPRGGLREARLGPGPDRAIPAKVKEIMLTPIAGEITEREPYNGYLIFQGGIPEVERFVSSYWK